jgi:uncharacterized protein YycO
MMMRVLALTAAASALLAAPALAETNALPVAGKAPEQISKEVWKAAHRACAKEAVMTTLIDAHRACVRNTYRTVMVRSGDPKLAALATQTPGS